MPRIYGDNYLPCTDAIYVSFKQLFTLTVTLLNCELLNDKTPLPSQLLVDQLSSFHGAQSAT